MFVTFTNNAPLLIASLRLVDAQHHTLALGVRQIFLRLLGDIPGPIILGALIDATCMVWKQSGSEEAMNCLKYDLDNFRYYTFGFSFGGKFLSFVLLAIAEKMYQLPSPTVTITNDTVVAQGDVVENLSVVNSDG